MQKKFLLLLSLVVVLSLTLAACGGNDDSDIDNEAGAQTSQSDQDQSDSDAAEIEGAIEVNETIVDSEMNHTVIVHRYIRNVPFNADDARSAEMREGFLVEVTLQNDADTNMVANLNANTMNLVSGDGTRVTLADFYFTEYTEQAGLEILKYAPSGTSQRGWVAFAPFKDQLSSLEFRYFRPEARISGGDRPNIPEFEKTIKLF